MQQCHSQLLFNEGKIFAGKEPEKLKTLQIYRSDLKIHAFVFLDSRFRGNDSVGRGVAEKTENLKHDGYNCKE